MVELRVKPKIDIAFKKIFADNPDLLKTLLEKALDLDNIKILKLKPNEITPLKVNEKFCRLDIRAEIDQKEVDIEIQINERGDFRERVLYYWAAMYTHLASGKSYDELPQTMVISFIDYNMFECSKYHSKFSVLEETRHELLTDKLRFHFFELKKVGDLECAKLDIEYWLHLIRAETEDEIIELEDLPENAQLKKAIREVRRLNADHKFITEVEAREVQLREEYSALSSAERKGKKEGRIEGRIETLAQNVNALLAAMPLEEIRSILKISDEDMGAIRPILNH